MKRKHLYLFVSVLTIAIAIWIISCAINPVTGKKEFMLLTESDELALGKQTDMQVVQTYGVYEDPGLNAYINNLGQRMVKITHRPNLPYQFKILDTPVLNAFAVPGGYVYFTRGILGYFNNEAELAGVMGHELGHVNARHTAQQYSRMQLAQLGLGVGMIFSESFRKYAGLAQFGVGLLFLRFSRDNERQADDLGVEYSMKIGYDATRMADFFETLERMNPRSGRDALPAWFSTHPNPVDRIAAVKRKAREWQQKLGAKQLAVNRNQYLQKINGIVFGNDPRQGYVEGNAFYHPLLKFFFPVPKNWQLNNTPSQVQIVSQQQDAAILFSIARAGSPLQAARTFVSDTKATVQSFDAVSVNGLPAQRLVTGIRTDQDSLQVLSYFIQKGDKVYVFHGFASVKSFPTYKSIFINTMSRFRRLTDARKINVKPDRIQIRTVKRPGTLRQVLQRFKVGEKELELHALLNGMHLQDNVKANTLIKIIKH